MLFAAIAVPIAITEVLTIGSVGRGGRIPFPTDVVVDQIIQGTWKNPVEGDTTGTQKWTAAKAGADGWFNGLRGYSFAKVNEPRYRVAILRANGHGMVYVNGIPRMGDPYGYGYGDLPVALKAGENTFLFANGRGRLKAEIVEPSSDLYFNLGDMTTPDVIADGKKRDYVLGAILVNATEGRSQAQEFELLADGRTIGRGKTPRLQALEARKIPLKFSMAAPAGESVKVTLKLDGRNDKDFTLRVRKPDQSHKVTFMSQIDGSVQYYAVVPPTNPKASALVLTVHGASVEAQGQAEAYSAKEWCWIVAATNRRPYGFDWEEIGRMDALEVLEQAKKSYKIDPRRVYLTGHSMGGHGTWILGATFPQLFGAIAPSAGWRSFFTYGGKPNETGSEMIDFLSTASNTSRTELMYSNYKNQEVYILHGDADDNVPVSEARAMKKVFEEMPKPIWYYEEPKAGHWWDGDKSPGADCVDWPPIFEMFEKSRVAMWGNFVTVNPAVSSGFDGAEILRQEKKLRPSSIYVNNLASGRAATTSNVSAVRLRGVRTLDGQEMPSKSDYIYAEKVDGVWEIRKSISKQYGPFKEVFQNRFAFVFGTGGTPEENAWMLNKARYDAEQLWYRGNGGAEVLSDKEAGDLKGRNVIVYGNSRVNAVWGRLLQSGPLDPRPNEGMLMIRPEGNRFIGMIGGGALKGMRATERLPYFTSGVAYPDWVIVGADIAEKGNDAVLGAGYWNSEGKFGETVRK